jgi:excisionase family DNA binding protein
MTKYMTTKEVAAELEVSSATIVRWVRDGAIPAKRFGQRTIRIPRVEIESLLNQKQSVEVK